MSFRQFPPSTATAKATSSSSSSPKRVAAGTTEATPRYELDDGRQLVRNGREFTTSGGELRLTI